MLAFPDVAPQEREYCLNDASSARLCCVVATFTIACLALVGLLGLSDLAASDPRVHSGGILVLLWSAGSAAFIALVVGMTWRYSKTVFLLRSDRLLMRTINGTEKGIALSDVKAVDAYRASEPVVVIGPVPGEPLGNGFRLRINNSGGNLGLMRLLSDLEDTDVGERFGEHARVMVETWRTAQRRNQFGLDTASQRRAYEHLASGDFVRAGKAFLKAEAAGAALPEAGSAVIRLVTALGLRYRPLLDWMYMG